MRARTSASVFHCRAPWDADSAGVVATPFACARCADAPVLALVGRYQVLVVPRLAVSDGAIVHIALIDS
jgi:hypothetical protein